MIFKWIEENIVDPINDYVIDPLLDVVGEVITWFVDIPDIGDLNNRDILVNKNSNIEPIPVVYGRRKLGGTRVAVKTSDDKKYLYIVLVVAEGEIDGFENVFLDDIPLGASRFAGKFVLEQYTGTDAQTASPTLVSAFPSLWTAEHRLRGLAYIVLRLEYDPEVFRGVPTITTIIRGRKVYDPRTATTAYSDNPALCLLDYLTNARFGKGLSLNDLNLTAFSQAANDCDASVSKYTGASGTDPIFTCNTVLNTNNQIFDNCKRLLSGMRGMMPYENGQYSLKIEDDESSVMSFDIDNIIGGIGVSFFGKDKRYNKVTAKFVNPDANWQPDSVVWPPSGSSEETTFLSEDEGIELATEITLDTITDYYAARDLARIVCLASRKQNFRIQFKATSDAIQLLAGEIITVTHPTMNWTDEKFRVAEISIASDGTVSIAAQKHDPTIYPWITSSEQDANGDLGIVDVYGGPVAPTNLVVSQNPVVQNDGSVLTDIELNWDDIDGYFVEDYEIQYRLTGQTNYQILRSRESSITIFGVVAGYEYEVRIAGITSSGIVGSFLTDTVLVAGDSTAPSAPTGLTAVGGFQSVTLDWTGNTEDDLRGYIVYENSSNTFGTATPIAFVNADQFTRGGLAANQTKYYWVVAVDFSGNESSASTSANTTTNADPSEPADSPRNATGYVFYQIQQSGSPSTPSASSYNFTNGTFSGLTTNWDESVSVQTPIEGRNYWASRYSVVEQSFGGAQTISFTSAFVWQNFDGLVTFTNIEDGIDQNVTTIDGGNVDLINLNASNITTGTIASNVVYAGKIDLDDSTVDSGVNFIDPQWGSLSAAFYLESTQNSVGLYSEWTSGSTGSAIYGRADGFNEGAAVVGVNYSNSSSISGSYGGFFEHDSTTSYSFGAIGVTSSTSNTSGGLVGQSPFGGIALRVNQGRVVLGKAVSSEGAELDLASPSGVSWINDVTSTSQWRVYYNTSPFNQMFLTTSGNLTISGSYSPFTGSHLALVDSSTNTAIGDIAVDTDTIYKQGISQTITVVDVSSSEQSKRAIGVFSTEKSAIRKYEPSEQIETQTLSGQTVTYDSKARRDERLSHFDQDLVDSLADEGKQIVYVNALGEGQINVCGQAGDIEAGDLIVTSGIAGKGMKQSDDILRSITVAKARESVTFNNASEIKQIACIYLCG